MLASGWPFWEFAFGVLLGIARLAYGDTGRPKGSSPFAILFAFVGLQFFALGVMGEYIGGYIGKSGRGRST